MAVAADKPCRLRYPARCAACGASLPAGTRAFYDTVPRKAHCLDCGPGPTVRVVSRPGGSARLEFERRRANRHARIRRQVPVIGGLVASLSTSPQHELAWQKGANGEELAAASLERRTRRAGVVWLHDRKWPGRRANIDHVGVGPGGITVVDAKYWRGRVEIERHGLFRPRVELRVGGRDCTSLVAGVLAQVSAVQGVLGARDLGHLSVRGALLFVEGDLPLLGLPDLDTVTIGWPRAAARLARRAGSLTPCQVASIANQLDAVLPPAG